MVGIVRMIVDIIFYVIEALLLLRFILVLFVANTSGTFARWIFANSAGLVAPFSNIFPTVKIIGFPVDLTVLFALIVFAIIGQLISRVLYYVSSPRAV